MTETLGATIPDDVERAVHAVLKTACDRSLTLTAAESCTGGLLASLLTDVEGASHAFERGFVVYSKEAKCELLHIAPERIDRCGAVSREVALAMAEGALAASHADIALSITGFAGPAGSDDEPGLVHLACARHGRETRAREEHFGDIGRGPTRIAAIRTALEMISEMLA
ncbi:CinA family protein [Stakelama saccharophila]|uniref:CinA family protein n=1 Tax=Stakelama saccharophila TaxID=3075605 RepID=A0ABZ0B6G6_9SPHN|nr:CinA family protein [Stakelama sp. W311]WNO52978.1 CinA family protein [Stakelama sp. W311]